MKTAPAVERIKSHLAQLERADVSQAHRFMYWRLIADAARDGHTAETQQLDETKARNTLTVASEA